MELFGKVNSGLRASAIFLLAIVAFIVVTPFGKADAALYKRFSIGAWKGGIYTNNKTGEFSHCAASAKYKSGITLLFSVTRSFTWQVGFSKNTWDLSVGKTFPVRYQVDRRKIMSGKARAATPKLAVIKLPASSRLFNQMRQGRKLKLKASNDLLVFNLTGTSRLLAQLLKCSKRNTNLVTNRSLSSGSSGSKADNPFESSDLAQPAKKPKRVTTISLEQRDEARVWLQNTLVNNNIAHTVVRNEGKGRKLYKKYAIVWRAGRNTGIIGSLQIVPGSPPEGLMSRVLANEARICKGDFASRFINDDDISSVRVKGLLVSCNLSEGKQWNAYFALTKRERGGSYLVTLLSSKASAGDVSQAGERITSGMQMATE